VITEHHRSEQNTLSFLNASDELADFLHDASNVTAVNVRQFDARKALTSPKVEVVQCTGFHTHQDTVLAQDWVGNFFVFQYSGTAKLVEAYGFHNSSNETRQGSTSGIRLPVTGS
jgi:hypothetical protein